MANPVLRWSPVILSAAAKYKIPPSILAAQIQLESGGKEGLTSSAGAQGLTQFMPGTAQSYNVNVNPGHAHSQIFGAAHYLSDLGFNRDARKAIASYAAGPGNYQAGLSYADKLLATAKQYASLDGRAPQAAPDTPAKAPAAPSVDQGQQRAGLISNYLSNQHNPDALTSLAAGLLSMGVPKQIASKAVPATGRPGSSPTVAAPGSAPDEIRTLIERANQIDRKHLPYVWGGGHSRSGVPDRGTGRDPGIGFDCSGAVAAVLGVDPRHSSQFASWGKPGRAKGGQGITVYSNSHHVLMEINGHFFGTSQTNPGRGAGWIPRAAISESYLAGFTARHL